MDCVENPKLTAAQLPHSRVEGNKQSKRGGRGAFLPRATRPAFFGLLGIVCSRHLSGSHLRVPRNDIWLAGIESTVIGPCKPPCDHTPSRPSGPTVRRTHWFGAYPAFSDVDAELTVEHLSVVPYSPTTTGRRQQSGIGCGEWRSCMNWNRSIVISY